MLIYIYIYISLHADTHAIHINLNVYPLPQGMVSPCHVGCGWVVMCCCCCCRCCCCYKRSLACARRRHTQQAHPKPAKFVRRCFPRPELQIANKQADPKRSAVLGMPQAWTRVTTHTQVHPQSQPWPACDDMLPARKSQTSSSTGT